MNLRQIKLFSIILVVLIMIPGASFVNAEEATGKILVKVKGLVCDFCATALKKTLQKVDAVSDSEVDLTEKVLTIHLKENQDLTDEEVAEYVTNSGYNIESITRE